MSNWQDWALAVSLLAFNVALVPSVLGSIKPRIATSLITTLFIIPQIIVFASLMLWYSLAMSALNCCLWATLAIQRYNQTKEIS